MREKRTRRTFEWPLICQTPYYRGSGARQFRVAPPNTVGDDITYICTHEGWLYLAVVLDLNSGRVIRWPVQPQPTTQLVVQALLMAVWRRRLTTPVTDTAIKGASTRVPIGWRSSAPITCNRA